MRTRNIECQIAQGQINRYLTGDTFSEVALKQLESHVTDCAECQDLLSQRRSALQAMLEGAITTPIRTENPAPSAVVHFGDRKSLSELIREQAARQAAEPVPVANPTETVSAPARTGNLKPLAYCGALGLVLIGMNFASRQMNGFFESKGAPIESPISSTPNVAAVTPAVSPAPKEEAFTPPASDSSVTEPVTTAGEIKTEAAATTPAAAPTSTDAPATPTENPRVAANPVLPTARRSQTTSRPARAAKDTPKPKATAAPAGIRVYDESGNPISTQGETP